MNPNATLDDLEGPGWADPDYPSTIVQRLRELGRIPLRELTPEDCRLILTQKRALGTLIPFTLDILEADPFVEGDLYAGDLLVAVTRIPSEFWRSRSDLHGKIKRIVGAALTQLGDLDESDRNDLEPQLRAAYGNL